MGINTMTKENHPIVNTNTLDFLRKNVVSITEITRSNKLSEILESFSNDVTEEVFVIQNTKKKKAQAVMVDLEYFEQLLHLKETLEASLDQAVMEEAYARRNQPANFTLSEIFDEEDINVDNLLKLLEED